MGKHRLENPDALSVSFVVPCLNEAESLPSVLGDIAAGCNGQDWDAEVIVADNGSSDSSRAIARESGAHVIEVAQRGYGAALTSGIEAATGDIVVMGDADGSYDFRQAADFVAAIAEGADIAQGCRLPVGGGVIEKGAMPFLHRRLGNPLFSMLGRRWMNLPINDVYCGLRAFDRSRVVALELQCQGMEFAVEMLVRAGARGYRISEVPTTLRPDLRLKTQPHLRTFRDGWRTLRLFLLYSPRWLYLVPGITMVACGLSIMVLAWFGVELWKATLDVHSLLAGAGILIVGCQGILFAFLTKTYGITSGLLPPDAKMERLYSMMSLETGLVLGSVALLGGLMLLASATFSWWGSGFGPLDYSAVMRVVVPGITLSILGVQAVLFSWFFSILGMRRP